MPDIDIDFCMNRRGEVIDYVTRKYGREQVAQIITFNTMAAKAAIKDVGRALDMPYGDVDRIAKMIPTTIGITIDQALEENRPAADRLRYRAADQGADRHGDASSKAWCAVQACTPPASSSRRKPLTELVPVTAAQERRNRHRVRHEGRRKDGPAQDGLSRADDAHRHRRLPEADRDNHERRDRSGDDCRSTTRRPTRRSSIARSPQVSSSLNRAACAMCFAATSPTSVEDLTALNALYRPGPIQGGMIDDFIERKWGRRKVEYELPELEDDPEGDAGRHRLPGAGDADRQRRWRATRSATPTCCAAPWARRIADEMAQAARHASWRARPMKQASQRQGRAASST